MSRPITIAIVGGSFAGVLAGALLSRRGHQVVVLERDPHELRGYGQGVVGHRDLDAILQALDCAPAGLIGVALKERLILDRSGQVLDRHVSPQVQLSWDRLYRDVRAQIPHGAFRAGVAVEAITVTTEGARLQLADGRDVLCDLVLGADGPLSIVRRHVTGLSNSPRDAGYVAWRGSIAETDLPAAVADQLMDRYCFFNPPRQHLLGYTAPGPLGEVAPGHRRYSWTWYRGHGADAPEGQVRAVRALPTPRMPSAARMASLRNEAVALLPPSFAAAVVATRQPILQSVVDYVSPVFSRGPVALIGDAAVVLRPHATMNLAKAAGDVLALDRCLCVDAPEAAMAAYSAERQPIGQSLAAFGRRLGQGLG
jgi:2-polyprenyl-6-methoxyphenol hydroxylase-like FAD-dependent oxidoreductase